MNASAVKTGPDDSFDVVIVDAGSARCVLAQSPNTGPQPAAELIESHQRRRAAMLAAERKPTACPQA